MFGQVSTAREKKTKKSEERKRELWKLDTCKMSPKEQEEEWSLTRYTSSDEP